MKVSSHPYRRVLLAAAACVAALAGSVLLPAAASAQPADTPTITLVLSPATVDYGHQNVNASGTVTASGGPVVGATVTVGYVDVDGQSEDISISTGSDGSYSGTILDPETAPQQVTASVAATSTTTTASAPPAQLGFTKDAVTIAGSFAQSSVNAGSTDTFSGIADYVSGGSPHPLANSPLSITFTESGAFNYSFSATVTTAPDGSFSYVTPAINLAIDSAEITVNSASTPYLEAGQHSVTVPVNQEAQFDDFTGTINPDRALQFLACAGIPEPLANSQLTGPVEYQYSRSPQGPWKTLGTVKDNADGSCFLGGNSLGDGTYAGKFTAPLANAYYRAFAPAVPGQMAAVSHVIHLWKYPTKITGFTITPRSVSRNGKVTVSGRLLRLTRKWTADARQRIVVEFRYKNKTYKLQEQLKTNSAGQFHGTFRVPHTAAWLALYEGGGKQFATASKAVTIRVR